MKFSPTLAVAPLSIHVWWKWNRLQNTNYKATFDVLWQARRPRVDEPPNISWFPGFSDTINRDFLRISLQVSRDLTFQRHGLNRPDAGMVSGKISAMGPLKQVLFHAAGCLWHLSTNSRII